MLIDYDVLGQRAEESIGEIDQLTPLAHDRAQARIEPAASWLRLGGHWLDDSLVASALTSTTRYRAEL
jgi:hypothetical protein